MKYNPNKDIDDSNINENRKKTLTLLSGKLGSDLRAVAPRPSNPQCVTIPYGNFSLSENVEELKMQRGLESVSNLLFIMEIVQFQ